jgi:hypothetical protein
MCIPPMEPWSIPAMPCMDPPWPMSIPPPMPMSAMVRNGRGSMGGIGPAMPSRGASVPRAKPVRSSLCAKIV